MMINKLVKILKWLDTIADRNQYQKRINFGKLKRGKIQLKFFLIKTLKIEKLLF